jgi:predicted dithiol-disulfide oxidoreductase (DUF899 family)
MPSANEEIATLEKEIREKKRRLAELRRAQPPKAVSNHAFDGPDGAVALSDLFAGKSDLILISNMGKSCAFCTLWADGFNGAVPELESRTGFALMSADPIEVATAFAAERRWRFRVVSGDKDTRTALNATDPDGDPWPLAIGFHRAEDGTITEVARAQLGEGDDFCPTWHLLDLLKDGWNGWEPAYRL